jgi:hypothetical protein
MTAYRILAVSKRRVIEQIIQRAKKLPAAWTPSLAADKMTEIEVSVSLLSCNLDAGILSPHTVANAANDLAFAGAALVELRD